MKKIFFFLLIVTACGKDGGSDSSPEPEIFEAQNEANAQYRVILGALNGKSSFGTASFEFDEEKKLHINFSMIGFPGQVSHAQSLHVGEKCPTNDDDLNQDGFVNYEEGRKVFGELAYAFETRHGSQYTYADKIETSEWPQDVKLQGKTLVVYGTSGPLPETVGSTASLPVACGILQKVQAN